MALRTPLAALALAFALPVTAEPVTHAQGVTEIDGVPQTVVVFDVATLDTLAALGVPVAGAPGGRVPASFAPDASPVGTLFEPDVEAVTAIGPDLIIVGGRSASKYAELSALAPTVDLSVQGEDYLAGVRHNVETLGGIFGREAQAAEQLAALDADVAALNALAQDAGRVLVVLTTGERMSIHGPGSRFGVIFDDYGFTPAMAGTDTGNRGQSITHEFILETDPDWLFVVDRDAATGGEAGAARQLLDTDVVRGTTAWQEGQVVYLDPAGWYITGGGLQTLRGNIAQLVAALEEAGTTN